jgi:hypothetical protein
MEATGAHPKPLLAGANAIALDMDGEPYSKKFYEFWKDFVPATNNEIHFLAQKIISYSHLLLIASQQGTKFKTRAVFEEIVESLQSVADDFGLEASIHDYLVETGQVVRRNYRVEDLRKFPEFARLIGYKDDKRRRPEKLFSHTRTRGWIPKFYLHESPVLPPEESMKLPTDVDYVLDGERPIPEKLSHILDRALYWEIKEFSPSIVK